MPDDYGECYCGERLTLRHECYHWPPRRCQCHPTTDTPVAWAQDVLDALAAAEAERDHYRQRANSAEARMGNYRADNAGLTEARVTALRLLSEGRERATRLATLAQAARAYMTIISDLDLKSTNAYFQSRQRAWEGLCDAVRALDAAGDGG